MGKKSHDLERLKEKAKRKGRAGKLTKKEKKFIAIKEESNRIEAIIAAGGTLTRADQKAIDKVKRKEERGLRKKAERQYRKEAKLARKESKKAKNVAKNAALVAAKAAKNGTAMEVEEAEEEAAEEEEDVEMAPVEEDKEAKKAAAKALKKAAKKAAKAAEKASKEAKKAAEKEEVYVPKKAVVPKMGERKAKGKCKTSAGAKETAKRPKVSGSATFEFFDFSAKADFDVDAFRSEKEIIGVHGGLSVAPWRDFDTVSSIIPKTLTKIYSKFKEPSPIQAQCWPLLIGGRDVIGVAQTGSGKTLGFGLPGALHVLENRRGKTRMLVLSPTRELAMQIDDVMQQIGRSTGLTSICVYGGTPKHPQRKALRSGVDVVIATPGRLKDLLEEGCADFSNVSYFVLDEADRMLDMGFIRDVNEILSHCTQPDRQTALFSATWPDEVRRLARTIVTDAVRVVIGQEELTANENVKQVVEVIDGRSKTRRLEQLLEKYHGRNQAKKTIVFALYKKEAQRIERDLKRNGWKCTSIHGDKQQADRIKAIDDFKATKVPLLIATDVAGRGLDVPDVEFVINNTFPLTIEDYVHRIGRTGRAGKTGLAHTFFTTDDKAHSGELAKVLRDAGQDIPEDLLKFGTAIKKKVHPYYGSHYGTAGSDEEDATHESFSDSD